MKQPLWYIYFLLLHIWPAGVLWKQVYPQGTIIPMHSEYRFMKVVCLHALRCVVEGKRQDATRCLHFREYAKTAISGTKVPFTFDKYVCTKTVFSCFVNLHSWLRRVIFSFNRIEANNNVMLHYYFRAIGLNQCSCIPCNALYLCQGIDRKLPLGLIQNS